MTARESSAGIIIYRKTGEGPRFLLLYHGGRYWNFPKGKIEPMEKIHSTALREINEETGLEANDLKLDYRFRVHDYYFFVRNKRRVFKKVVYFLAETKRSEIKISDEHLGYGWFLYRDAQRLLIYQNLKKILKMAYASIRSKNKK